MLKLILILSTIISISIAGVYPNYRYDFDFVPLNDNDDWWRTANFYQIYPRSFQDSDGDGVGDLNGITERLSYLKEIGITATWLSPIFTSPMKDFGYDISNFYEIDPIFGTMEDFEKLLKRAKELDIKIVLDFVPNHSSDKCEWFTESIKRNPEYEDFYVWHPGREDPKNKTGKRLPPSNWVSVFRGSAWEWNEERGEYYLHQFVAGQPDLNFRNDKVHKKMKHVLEFWLLKGVSGFRIDAVPHVYECAQDKDGNFIDEPRNEDVKDPNDYGYLKHTCTTDQPETIQLVYEWRKIMDDFQKDYNTETKVLMAETYSPLDIVMKYYGDGTVKGAHIPFNFNMISWLSNSSNANDYSNAIKSWLDKMTDDRTPNWVLGNHDKNRVGSRLGTDRIDMLNMILMTLPGIAVTYQGEEIGMTDVWISWHDTVDPSACNSNKEIYEKLSRDPERTPFQWNDSKNAGFSTAKKTWLPVSSAYKTLNVKRQRGIAKSHLNIYKQLRKLRDFKTFKGNKAADVKALNNNVLVILRVQDDQHFITLANINDSIENVNLLNVFKNLPLSLQYVVPGESSPHRIGEQVMSDRIILLPKESVVLSTVSPSVIFADSENNDGYYKYELN